MLVAVTAERVGITLLEKGVMSRVPKSRARNKRWIREGILYNSYIRVVV
jgi:hypothetical protein